MQNLKTPLNPIEIDVTRLPSKGRRVKVELTADELSGLADSFGLLEASEFNANLVVTRWRRDGVKIEGSFNAEIKQPCVLTLEPVQQKISEEVSLILVPEGSPFAKPKLDVNGELLLDPDGADMPDTFDGATIDLGRILLEVFALSVDPHPRAENVVLDDIYKNEQEESVAPPSPFAVLAQLKSDKSN